MNEWKRNIAVGLTTAGGLVALAVLLMLFGYVPAWLQPSYPVQVVMLDAGGLREDSVVTLSGIPVGRVKALALSHEPGQGVVITAEIDDEYAIPAGVVGEVRPPLIGGGSRLSLMIGPDAPPGQTLPRDGSAVVTAEVVSPLGDVTGDLKGVLGGSLDQLSRVSAQVEQLAAEWTQLARNLNALSEQRDLDAVDAGLATGNLATVMARTDARLRDLRGTLEAVNRYLNDPELRDNIAGATANARELTAEAAQTVADIRKAVDALTKRYVAVADDVSKTLAGVDRAVADARAGDGTVGKLLQDPALYNNLNDAAVRLQKALAELDALVTKLREEGIEVAF